MINKLSPVLSLLQVITLLFLCYVIFFHHLGEFSIRLWDEGRNGVNAVEMVETNNWIVTQFRHQPDLWNVKPPLHIWVVAIFFKLFGVSELSLRLPSAISATLTIFIMYFFCHHFLKNKWIGFLSGLIILSSMGFPDTHIGRTGDYDALLVLMSTVGVLTTFLYTVSSEKRYLYLAATFWVLSFMTKGIAGLLLLPGILLYFLTFNRDKLVNKHLLLLVILSLATISVFLSIREASSAGYINAVLEYEFFGRYSQDLANRQEGFLYYWNLLSTFRYQKWIYFAAISPVAYFLIKDSLLRKFVIFGYTSSFFYFIIISTSATKQFWYDAQLYPIMSLLVAILIIALIQRTPFLIRLAPIIVLCFYLQRYIRTNIAYIHRPDLDKQNPCIQYGYLFRDKKIDFSEFAGIHIDNSCSAIQFYLDKNKLLRKDLSEIVPGDKILSCDPGTINQINGIFANKLIFDNHNGCLGLEIVK